MLKINQAVPDFTLKAYYQDKIKDIKLSDYKGKWVVLIFYPGDFTFICPTELEEAANMQEELKKKGAEILSVSADSVYVHKAWHEQSPAIKGVNFPMLSDSTGKVAKEFGAYIDEDGICLRGTFIIDPDGILKTMEIHSNDIGRSGKELMRKLDAAIFVRNNKGLVCPASWTPGADTLKPGLDLVGKI